MTNKYQCAACGGTGEAPEAIPVSLRDFLDDSADDLEATMNLLAERGANFSVVIGDAIDAMRLEVIRMDTTPTPTEPKTDE